MKLAIPMYLDANPSRIHYRSENGELALVKNKRGKNWTGYFRGEKVTKSCTVKEGLEKLNEIIAPTRCRIDLSKSYNSVESIGQTLYSDYLFINRDSESPFECQTLDGRIGMRTVEHFKGHPEFQILKNGKPTSKIFKDYLGALKFMGNSEVHGKNKKTTFRLHDFLQISNKSITPLSHDFFCKVVSQEAVNEINYLTERLRLFESLDQEEFADPSGVLKVNPEFTSYRARLFDF